MTYPSHPRDRDGDLVALAVGTATAVAVLPFTLAAWAGLAGFALLFGDPTDAIDAGEDMAADRTRDRELVAGRAA